jgi:murein DD-endopeptidase MepM/ murein hydrolase activator NlpD
VKLRSFALGTATIMMLMVLLFWAVADWPAPEPLPVRAEPVAAPPYLPGAAAAPPALTATPQTADTQRSVVTVITTPAVAAGTIDSVQREPQETPPAQKSPASGLVIPVAGVRPRDLVDTYEQSRSQGRRHDAIDIAAARGTPVLAVAPGSVAKLFVSERGGIALYQLAPDKHTIYYYAHMDRYADGITDGKSLQQGDVIGYVGDTGNAGAGNYHLHFSISTIADPKQYWGGTPQNPYPLLRQGISQPR